MRIAYVNANYQQHHTGGGNAHIEQFVSNVIALGHEVWTYPGSPYPGLQHLPTSRLAHVRAMRSMDALYVRLENRLPMLCTWTIPPRRLLYGFPLVAWEFNTLPDELDPSLSDERSSRLLHHCSRGCDLAVCVSPALTDIVRNELQVKQVLTVPNGSDPSKFRPDAAVVDRLSVFKEKFNVVWIGSIKESWHDLELLKAAAVHIQSNGQGNDIQFHILGAGLNAMMGSMPPNVFYWGAEIYDHLPNWLAGMQVGLSLYQVSRASFGSPLKLFDYLSSGLSVISTEHPVAGELLSTIGCPDLVIPHGDAAALADALLRLAGDRERVRRLGMAGRQLVIDRYNWRRAVQDTLNEMEMILKEKRGK